MTTIAAQKTKDGWVFAWDNQVTNGRSKSRYGLSKVFRNRWVFGLTGAVRAANLLQTMDIPKLKEGQSTFQYAVNALVPKLQKVMRKQDYPPFSLLVEINGDVFEINDDFSVIPVKRFIATGSGGVYADAALKAGADLKKAIQIASDTDLYTGFKVTVKESKNVL